MISSSKTIDISKFWNTGPQYTEIKLISSIKDQHLGFEQQKAETIKVWEHRTNNKKCRRSQNNGDFKAKLNINKEDWTRKQAEMVK